jgi:hypothetical protein
MMQIFVLTLVDVVAFMIIESLTNRKLRFLEALLFAVVFNLTILTVANAEPVRPKFKVAIIDTGYISSANTGLKLCSTGHYDFRVELPVVGHTRPHGTLVAEIIAKKLRNVDYCAVIYQIEDRDGHYPLSNLVAALKMSMREHVDAVNYSLNGFDASIEERDTWRQLSTKNIMLFVAAGNKHSNLDVACLQFPVCYDIQNLYAVGALDSNRKLPAAYSNFGKSVRLWFNGDSLHGTQGTSFAAPRALSEYILRLANIERSST